MNYKVNSGDHIYYDLKLSNVYDNRAGGLNSEEPVPFSKKDETSEILNKQSDYKMAISSFSLDLAVPVMIMSIQEASNTDINKSIFSCTMTFGGIDYQEFFTYISDIDLTASPLKTPKAPSANNGLQDFSNGYYYMFNYASWVRMINTTLTNLTNLVNTATPGTISSAPFYEYDNNRFNFIYPTDFPGNNVDIFFNLAFVHVMSGYRYKFIKYNNTAYKTFQLIMTQNENAYPYSEPYAPMPSPPNFWQLKQQFDCRYRLNGISQIVITSDSLGVRKEYYPQVKNPNNTGVDIGYQQFNTPTLPIIASFSLIDSENSVSWIERQYYQPPFLRWIDLLSEQPLTIVDVRVYYQLRRGELILSSIPIDTQSIIKFVFKRKDIPD
jgi:hypothetical protein